MAKVKALSLPASAPSRYTLTVLPPSWRFQAGNRALSSWRPFGTRARDASLGDLGAQIETAIATGALRAAGTDPSSNR